MLPREVNERVNSMKRQGKPNEKSTGRVIREIDNSGNELVNLLRELVRIRTVNPPGENYVECANLLSRRFKEVGMNTNLIEVPETDLRKNGVELPRVSVLSMLKGATSNKTLHINGHYDVVPTAPGWTFDPFGGTVSDGKMYGRGTTDMKCGIVAMIIAVTAMLRSGVKLDGDLTMSATPDEETGGDLGAGFLVKNGFIKGDSTIVAEGSRFNEVALAHKGAFWLEVKTIGKSAHGSSPGLG
jgi:succinyl-diaminopimelate desuccinylase